MDVVHVDKTPKDKSLVQISLTRIQFVCADRLCASHITTEINEKKITLADKVIYMWRRDFLSYSY